MSQQKQQGALRLASEVKSSERAEERPKVGASNERAKLPGILVFCADNAVCAHSKSTLQPRVYPAHKTGGEALAK